ncbi:MAG: YciI family protein [Usitatibacteraceae bacterium]
MQYMILIYGDEKQYAAMANNPEAMKQMYAAYSQYSADLQAAGVMRGGAELKPVATATTVRVKNGKTVTTDGPFAETKEQLGGFYNIDVANLDEAVKWAARCPGAQDGCVEVRPVGLTPDTN